MQEGEMAGEGAEVAVWAGGAELGEEGGMADAAGEQVARAAVQEAGCSRVQRRSPSGTVNT